MFNAGLRAEGADNIASAMPQYRKGWDETFTYNDYKRIKEAEREYTKLGIAMPPPENIANMVHKNAAVRDVARAETLKQLKEFVEKTVPDTPAKQQARDLRLTCIEMIENGKQPQASKKTKAARDQFEFQLKSLLADFALAKGEFTLGTPDKLRTLREAAEQRIKDLGV
jgi:glycerol-3-phosphate cytidylyltransferase-like family protein